MKKIYVLFLFFCFINISYAYDCENIENSFEKYKCRSENICKNYDDNKKVYNPETFKEADFYKEVSISDVLLVTSIDQKPIKKAVSIYKENINNVYKCALIQVQKNSLKNIKQKFLKLDKTWDIKKSIEPKIDQLNNKLDIISKSSKCLWIDKETTSNKLSVLRQTTYLTCDYAFYIEYLKDYYKNIGNVIWEQEEVSNIEAGNKILNISKSLDKELNHSLKIFPIAYHAYSEYENNFPVHFLLELLIEDFNILRNKLHEVINPINQVWYKIINAMWK